MAVTVIFDVGTVKAGWRKSSSAAPERRIHGLAFPWRLFVLSTMCPMMTFVIASRILERMGTSVRKDRPQDCSNEGHRYKTVQIASADSRIDRGYQRRSHEETPIQRSLFPISSLNSGIKNDLSSFGNLHVFIFASSCNQELLLMTSPIFPV